LHIKTVKEIRTAGKNPEGKPLAALMFSEMDAGSLESVWGTCQEGKVQQEQQQMTMAVDDEEIAQVVAAHLARHRHKRRRALMQSSSKQQLN
jgi:hypothetical protein